MFKGSELSCAGEWQPTKTSCRMNTVCNSGFYLSIKGINPHISTDLHFSVVPQITSRIEEACEYYIKRPVLFLCVSHKLNIGMQLKIDNPAELGNDRIVDILAVKTLYGFPACLIDFGTATTSICWIIGGLYRWSNFSRNPDKCRCIVY
jgi:type III pantothenate kinase